MITRATEEKGGHITCGFVKERQSELVFEYFSEIVYCRTRVAKSPTRYLSPTRNPETSLKRAEIYLEKKN